MTTMTERELLKQETDRLSAEGFDVFLEPRTTLLPSFAEGYTPDAIAFGSGRKIALEIATRGSERDARIQKVASLFARHPEWEFRVLWVEPAIRAPGPNVQSKEQIAAAIREIKKLRDARFIRPSFLLAWATLEAAGRAIATGEFARPQTPGRLVQILGRDGHLTPSEADAIRDLSEKRNRLVHGQLDEAVELGDVDRILVAVEEIVSEIPPG